MSKLHQMQLTFVPAEDRMMFRVNTEGGHEFRFWMTRRYTELLFKALADLLRMDMKAKSAEAGIPSEMPRVPDPAEEMKESIEIEAEHRENLQKSNFETPYEESQSFPLGEQPILLFRIAIKPGPQGGSLLCLHPENGGGIELALNAQIAHSLCRLLAETSDKADWKLDLRLVKPGPPGGDQSGLN